VFTIFIQLNDAATSSPVITSWFIFFFSFQKELFMVKEFIVSLFFFLFFLVCFQMELFYDERNE